MHKFLFLCFLCFVLVSNAQTVKLVVPYSPGGVTDRAARIVEKTLTNRLSYNFVIEYQTGAGGLIAANNVAKNTSKETVLLVHSSAVTTNTLNPNATYDLAKDFVPVAKLGSVPMILVTANQTSITNLQQLKQSNLPILYATAGSGTATHVAGLILQHNLKKDMFAVPYKGEGAAFNDILSNNVAMMFVSSSVLTGYTNSSQLHMLAITGSKRNHNFPNVPTFMENNIGGFDRSLNFIVVLANSTADFSILTNIKSALEESFKNKQDRDLYTLAGIELYSQPTANVREFLDEEIKKIQPLKNKL